VKIACFIMPQFPSPAAAPDDPLRATFLRVICSHIVTGTGFIQAGLNVS
jgi:hypothetical protein